MILEINDDDDDDDHNYVSMDAILVMKCQQVRRAKRLMHGTILSIFTPEYENKNTESVKC